MQLNPAQQRAVDCDGHCLVVACPGSGKTRVITIKIGRLLKVYPDCRLLAVTFTRDSANELSRRVIQTIGEPLFRRACRIGTFHALCIRQLRNYGKLGKVATPREQSLFVRRAAAMAEPGMANEEAVAIIERAKGSLDTCPEQKSALYRCYSDLLASHQVSDLYDVVLDSVRLMRSGDIRPYPVRFMLVDEFQDTDPIQYEWVLLHARGGANTTVVGDDDQSIYSFRGSLGVRGMRNFVKDTGAEEITLGSNYRCRSEILSAADRLIRCNVERVEKLLVADRGHGGAILSLRQGARRDEAEAVADAVEEDAIDLGDKANTLFTRTVPDGRWCVLARTRRALDYVERELQIRGIQYYRSPGESFWSRAPYSIMLGLLDSLTSSQTSGLDHAIGHALMATVSKADASDALKKLHSQLGDHFGDIRDGAPINLEGFMANEAQVISELANLVVAWRQQIDAARFAMVIRGVAAWFAKFEMGEENKEIMTSAGETLCRLRGPIQARIQAITGERNKRDVQPQGVAILTMHGAKGLEFDHVWIVATEATTIPSSKSPDHEEERRLMYVAMTRAKDTLFMSSILSGHPSPFVIEAGCDPAGR